MKLKMSSSDSEDDLIHYGTPLEPLEEDEIPNKKPRLLEDQVVTDKQGRRRFHGAFTGGFSAGFFNTVGSLEGWMPSSFKSSKSKKQEIFQQKPEDFMDEEDQTEFGIAPVVLKAKKDYTNECRKEGSAFLEFSNFGTYVLQDLLKPVRETIGIKLLKTMGWKPGQGVGPKLNKKEKRNTLKIREKTYGCQLPPGSLEEEENDAESDSEWDDIEFAPSDYEPFLCNARTNFFGLGYEGLDKRPVLSGNTFRNEDDIAKVKNKKFGFGSQAFGVGAFEEEDEDIYARDDMSRYDFSLGNDQSVDVSKSTERNSTMDGVLEGFVLETKKHLRKHYPLPVLPKDYKPYHKVRRSRFDQPPPVDEEKAKTCPRVTLEEPRDVLETKKRKEAMAKELICNVKINEHKYKPFSYNTDKQERYENYLKLVKIGKKEHLSDLQPLSMTDWDREREKVEFEKAASLFKPLSGGMEDRFLTASQPDDLSDPLAVVEKYRDESDDRVKAAKMNMFGPLTRKTTDWTPTPLLCKRFNIPEPKKSVVQTIEKKTEKSYFNLFDAVQNSKEKVETTKVIEKPISSKGETRDEPEILEPNEKKLDETQSKTDLFKAIFLASDDEEENDAEEIKTDKNKEELPKSSQDDLLYEEKLINSKRNLSPPSGIFKNIDLDLLSGKKKTITVEAEPEKSEKFQTKDPNPLLPDLIYGPKIPEKVEVKPDFRVNERLEEDGVWVEKKIREGKKHKKKDKKNKKASHKSKHKHKKHKRQKVKRSGVGKIKN